MAGSIIGAVAAPLIGGAVSSMMGGGGGGSQQAAAAADPFAAQRPQYQQQLSDLMSGKTPFEMTPGAQFAKQEGLDAVSAKMGARGQASSGAEKIELERYATGFAGQQYQQQMSNLMTLSGATSGAPGTAGGIMADKANADQNAISTFGSTFGNAVMKTPTAQGIVNGGSSGGGGPVLGGWGNASGADLSAFF